MLTTQEAADKLGITQSGVRKLLARHVLEGEKRGRDLWVTEESVARRLRKKGKRA